MTKEEALDKARKLELQWIAMDEDGEWYGYTDKPTITDGGEAWTVLKGNICHLSDDGSLWRLSLTEVNNE